VYTVGADRVTPSGANVQDFSGLATATAFDFLGDGVAEAIYADETQIYVFDGKTGQINLTSPRQSGTLIEYPVVADIDNDGSAEIVYVSNYYDGQPAARR
jgi:Tfp pilus tip-associated adhesin PilY1